MVIKTSDERDKATYLFMDCIKLFKIYPLIIISSCSDTITKSIKYKRILPSGNENPSTVKYPRINKIRNPIAISPAPKPKPRYRSFLNPLKLSPIDFIDLRSTNRINNQPNDEWWYSIGTLIENNKIEDLENKLNQEIQKLL